MDYLMKSPLFNLLFLAITVPSYTLTSVSYTGWILFIVWSLES